MYCNSIVGYGIGQNSNFYLHTLMSLVSILFLDSSTSEAIDPSVAEFVFALNFMHGLVLLRVNGSSIFFPLLALSSS